MPRKCLGPESTAELRRTRAPLGAYFWAWSSNPAAEGLPWRFLPAGYRTPRRYQRRHQPDGNNVYVTSRGSDAVAIFKRNPDGTLEQFARQCGYAGDPKSQARKTII
jgi:hypothetical protein